MTEFLIRNGANVNAKDRNGQTPLHMAAKQGKNIYKIYEKVVNIVVSAGNLFYFPFCFCLWYNINLIQIYYKTHSDFFLRRTQNR